MDRVLGNSCVLCKFAVSNWFISFEMFSLRKSFRVILFCWILITRFFHIVLFLLRWILPTIPVQQSKTCFQHTYQFILVANVSVCSVALLLSKQKSDGLLSNPKLRKSHQNEDWRRLNVKHISNYFISLKFEQYLAIARSHWLKAFTVGHNVATSTQNLIHWNVCAHIFFVCF